MPALVNKAERAEMMMRSRIRSMSDLEITESIQQVTAQRNHSRDSGRKRDLTTVRLMLIDEYEDRYGGAAVDVLLDRLEGVSLETS